MPSAATPSVSRAAITNLLLFQQEHVPLRRNPMAMITIEIDDERLAEAKQLLHTKDDGETLDKAVEIAIGAIYQRRAARRRLSELAHEGGAFGEAQSA